MRSRTAKRLVLDARHVEFDSGRVRAGIQRFARRRLAKRNSPDEQYDQRGGCSLEHVWEILIGNSRSD